MRYLTPVLIVLLVISLIANGVMYVKFRSGRAILTVNGVGVSKYDMDSWLEQNYGPIYKANQTSHILIHQAAQKNNMAADDAEVNSKFQEEKQLNPGFAANMNAQPWLTDETRKTIQQNLELRRLLAKDIPVTEDDIQDEYKLHPVLYDTPVRAETEVALVRRPLPPKNEDRTADVVTFMNANPPIKPSTIMANLPPGQVRFLGDNNICILQQHLGTQENAAVFSMKPGEVKKMAAPNDLAAAGYPTMVIRMIKITPGAKANLKDSKTHDTIRMTVALKHARPASELIENLLQTAKIDAEEPTDVENIKRKLLPEKAAQNVAQGK